MKAAAKSFNVTAPTVSEQLKALEEYFGRKLFDRDSKKLSLTDFGREVYTQARGIFRSGDRLVSSLFLKEMNDYPIEIGISATLTNFFKEESLFDFVEENDAPMRIRFADSEILFNKLNNFEVDVVLSLDELFTNKQIGYVNGRKIELCMVVAEKVIEEGHISEKQCLERLPLITFLDDCALRTLVNERIFDLEVDPKIIAEVNEFRTMAMAVRRGKAVAYIPRTYAMACEKLYGIKIVSDDKDGLVTNIKCFFHPENKRDKIETIVEHLSQLS
jgi:DNA-binding transcriptional LysR family regulator